MEPSFEKAIPRKTNQVIVKKPNVDCLRIFSQQLTSEQRQDFKKKYGKIIDLLNVNVQVEGISALSQFYDPPLRCFTFKDFQLVPTLEEFAQIMGYPLSKGKPYHYIGHPHSFDTIANVLQVEPNDLKSLKQNKNTTIGIPIQYLENRMKTLAENKEWELFMDVLALMIYGVVLFPSVDDMVSLAAIGVLLNYKCEGQNPVHAVLADVFYTLNVCRKKTGKRMLCCLSVLYVWMCGHIFQREYKYIDPFYMWLFKPSDLKYCPIVDLKMLGLKSYSAREWVNILVKLQDGKVRWYPNWGEVDKVLYRCGEFSNVPLIGTRGCVNYNPSLALRQLAYPMIGPPPKESYTPFTAELTDFAMLKRIHRAWDEVVYKGKELGPRSCGEGRGYKKWVQDRVALIKLPFQMPSNLGEAASIDPTENLEVKEIKLKLAKIEVEKSSLEDELMEVRSDFKALKFENGEMARSMEQAHKRARIEERYLCRTKVCLRAANKELGLRNAEKNKVVRENQQLKAAQVEMKKHLKTLKRQLSEQSVEYDTTRKSKIREGN